MTFRDRVRRRPVAWYYGVVLAATGVVLAGLLLLGPPGTLLSAPTPALLALAALAGFVPSSTGIALTALLDGRPGLRTLGARLRRWRVPPAWWLAPLLPWALSLVAYWILGVRWPDAAPEAVGAKVLPGLAIGLMAGLGEEFGWRAFAQERLQQRASIWRAAFVTGLLWAGWHTLLNFAGQGWLGGWFLPVVFANAWVTLTAFAFLAAWVYNGTGKSMLLTVVFHAGISSSAFALGRTAGSPQQTLEAAFVMALLAAAAAALVVWWNSRSYPASARHTRPA